MAKTTKKYIDSVSDTVQFQQTFIKDVTLDGVTSLADVEKKGTELKLKLNRDNTKADKSNTYAKSEVYTKKEVDKLLAEIKELIK